MLFLINVLIVNLHRSISLEQSKYTAGAAMNSKKLSDRFGEEVCSVKETEEDLVFL